MKIYAWSFGRIVSIVILAIVAWQLLENWFGKKRVWRIFNMLLAALSVYGILKYTLIGRTFGEYRIMGLPTANDFVENTELSRQMIMNAFLFFPLGLTLPYSLPKKRRWFPIIATVVGAFILSASIEYIQYHFHLGEGELSDVAMNTLGAAVGTVSYLLYGCIGRSANQNIAE